MKEKKISIIIPVYNGSNYLRHAIDSALRQDYPNFEVIVVNDGSNDNDETEKITLSYGDKIRYFKKENGGVATALNYGIEKSEWEYISWLSHDDTYLSNKLSEQIEFLKTQNPKAIVISNAFVMNEKSEITQEQNLACGPNGSIYDILFRWLIHGCALLIPRKAFEDVWLFDADFKTAQDNHLWLRFIKAGYKFVHLPKALINIRVHSEQDSQKKSRLQMRERIEIERFAFKLFSPKEIAEDYGYRWNPSILVARLRFILLLKRIVPAIERTAKRLGLYEFIAPIYMKYVLKK